jgi:hypothetical protein
MLALRRLALVVVLAAVLPHHAVLAQERLMTPSEIDTCSNSSEIDEYASICHLACPLCCCCITLQHSRSSSSTSHATGAAGSTPPPLLRAPLHHSGTDPYMPQHAGTDTAPQITRVQTCARAAVIGRGGGIGISLSSGRAGVLRAAASACGDAVAGSLGELCAGGDPMATITSMATTCATSLAALYAKALTGSAVWGTAEADMTAPVTRAGALEACGSACGASQGAAEALAQAAACGVATATGQCMAAAASVSAAGFSRAFVKGATDAWGRACSTSGLSLSGGDTIAASAAAAVARAMAQVAANACANCPSCRCREPPLGAADWTAAAGNFSDAAAVIAAGRVGLARAVAQATTTFCESKGEREDARSAARGLLASHADLVAGALGAVRSYAYELSSNNSTWACGGASMAIDLQVRMAYWAAHVVLGKCTCAECSKEHLQQQGVGWAAAPAEAARVLLKSPARRQ